MKTQKPNNIGKNSGRRIIRHSNNRVKDQDHVTEMLKLCLQKICELQAEMEREAETIHDPEAEGYAACATETLRFLSSQGLPPDHPMVKMLSERLLRDRDDN
ncbi:unnamed protein product [Ceutorhynchus assimilis]|uniref:Uncharacterized protein n=1 Tax=Ceutorhynchus assimilis TaxID=467358 RepID=A0A9N9MXR7_9CUCU|nr:unnamed protein product [Ceutorhynchus assimilis]